MKQRIKLILLIIYCCITLNIYAENNNNNTNGINQATSIAKRDVDTGPMMPLSGGCNINAGGDFDICVTATSFTIYGSIDSNTILNSYTWTQITGPPVTITSPNNLITTVTGTFVPNTLYQFELCAYCDDSTLQCDIVDVYVWADVTPAIIMDALNNPITSIDACNTFTVFGNTPGVAENANWSYSNFNAQYSQSISGNSYTGSLPSSSGQCFTQNITYTISNAGCSSSATLAASISTQVVPVTINGNLNNQTFCAQTMYMLGSSISCNNTVLWTVLLEPVAGSATLSSPTSQGTNVTFSASGTYSFQYTVNSTGPSPGGTATVTFHVCVSNPNGLGPDETYYVCNYPTSVNLTSNWDPTFTYNAWQSNGGAGVVITPGAQANLATATVGATTANPLTFTQSAVVGQCTLNGTTSNCTDVKVVRYFLYPSVNIDSDTVNFFCGGVQFFNPLTYIPVITGGLSITSDGIIPTLVPIGSSIILNNNYPLGSTFDVQLAGSYIFMIQVANGTPCPDTAYLYVNVSSLVPPSAGTSIIDSICHVDTLTLVGSLPINQITGLPDPNAISLWQQISGPSGLTWIDPPSSQLVDLTGFQIGTYTFVYSFSLDTNCLLTDTMTITIYPCDSIVVVDSNCCGNWGGINYLTYSPTGMPSLSPLTCGSTVNYNCNPLFNLYNFQYFCRECCQTTFSASLLNTSNVQIWSGSNVGSNYTIANLPLLSNGVYTLKVYASCGDDLCDSCIITIVSECDSIPPCCGEWGDITHTTIGDDGAVATAIIPCGSIVNWNCPPLPNDYTFNYVCNGGLSTSFSGVLLNPSLSTVWTGSYTGTSWTINGTTSFGILTNGMHTLKVYTYCDSLLCDSCVIQIRVDCDSSCCGKWDTNYHSVYAGSMHTMQPISCGGYHQWNCHPGLNNFIYEYNCLAPCTTTFTGTLVNNVTNTTVWTGSSTGSIWNINGNAAFGSLANGWYTLCVYSYCGGDPCDTCCIRILVECEPIDTPCCGKWDTNYHSVYAGSMHTMQPISCGGYHQWNCHPGLNNFIYEYNCLAPCATTFTGTLVNNVTNTTVWTGSSIGSVWNINGNAAFGSLANGWYTLCVYSYCGGDPCDTCCIRILVECEPIDTPCCGKWDTNYHSVYAGSMHTMQPISCGGYHQWNCHPGLNNFIYEYNCLAPCTTTFTGTLVNNVTNTTVWTGSSTGSIWNINGNAAFGSLANGWYTLCVYSYCGGDPCDTCCIRILVECEPIDTPCCGKWDTNYHSVYAGSMHTMQPISCGGYHQWNCHPGLNNFIYEYTCLAPCTTTFTGTLVNNVTNTTVWTGSSTGSVWNINGNAAFGSLANGWYTLCVYSYCGGDPCDTCCIRILVECEPIDTPCCRGWGINSHTYYSSPTSPPVSQITACGANINYNCPPLQNMYNFNFSCYAPCTPSIVVRFYSPSNVLLWTQTYAGTAAINGTSLPFTVNGTYRLVAYGYCNGLFCDSCVFNIRKDCPPLIDCCRGWGINSHTYYSSPTSPPVSQITACGANINYNCPPLQNMYNFNFSCYAPCTPSIVVRFYSPSNVLLWTQTYAGTAAINGTSLPFTVNGTYRLVAYGYCNGLFCDSCVFNIRKDCPPLIDCCRGWGINSHTYYSSPTSPPVSQITACGANINYNCPPLQNMYNFNFSCYAPCTPSIVVRFYSPSNVLLWTQTYAGTAAINGTSLPFTVNGTYRLVAYGYCNGLFCDSCVFNIRKDCPPLIDCCRGWGINSHTYYSSPTSPPVSQITACGANINYNCPPLQNMYNFNFSCYAPCTPSIVVRFYSPSNVLLWTQTYAGTAAINGTSLPFTVNGTYRLVAYGYCNGLFCDSCVFNIRKDCHLLDPSCCGSWGNNTFTQYNEDGEAESVIIDCGNDIAWNCPPLENSYRFIYNCLSPCTPTYEANLVNSDGVVIWAGSSTAAIWNFDANAEFGFLSPGTYTLTVTAFCNSIECGVCRYDIRVDCPFDEHACLGWERTYHTLTYEDGSVEEIRFSCDDEIEYTCPPIEDEYVFEYVCNSSLPCITTYYAELYDASSTLIWSGLYNTTTCRLSGLPITENGTYTLSVHVYCCGQYCTRCNLTIQVSCFEDIKRRSKQSNVSSEKEVVLFQNIPNPFAESTIISYTIPKEGCNDAKIVISDMQGKIIKEVRILEAGEGKITVYAGDLSSGQYKYSIVINGVYIKTKSMMKE